jgi:hypothetical protein
MENLISFTVLFFQQQECFITHERAFKCNVINVFCYTKSNVVKNATKHTQKIVWFFAQKKVICIYFSNFHLFEIFIFYFIANHNISLSFYKQLKVLGDPNFYMNLNSIFVTKSFLYVEFLYLITLSHEHFNDDNLLKTFN